MAQFIPAILESDPAAIQAQLKQLDGLVERVQIDFADYTLVANQTVLPVFCSVNGFGLDVDAHLMVKQPGQYIATLVQQGFSRVIVHVEAVEDLAVLRRQATSSGIGFAVAINPDTSIDRLPPELDSIDFIQVMGVQPGFGGQLFLEITYDRIRSIKGMYDAVKIAVDGGVRLENMPTIVEAGADMLVVGKRGFSEGADFTGKIAEWQNLMN